jgi:CRP-like cAMP-binding protein
MPGQINSIHCAQCDFKSLLFDKLNPKELERLNNSKTEKVFQKGDLIISEGQEIKEFIYLQRGLVKMSKHTGNQKNHIISLALPKSFIGFLSVFSEAQYSYSITALNEATLCFIDIELIRKTILKNGAFALNVLTKISKVSDEIIFSRVNISARQLRGRIAYLLIIFSREIFYNTRFEVPITRREMGELIDMSTANVIRILSEFRKDKILKIDRSYIEILSYSSLEKVSKFG